jgi:hypothetical protein
MSARDGEVRPYPQLYEPVEHVKGTAIKRGRQAAGVAGADPIMVDGIYYEFVWLLRKIKVDC